MAAAPLKDDAKKELEAVLLRAIEDRPIHDSLEWLSEIGRLQDEELLEGILRSLAGIRYLIYKGRDLKGFALTPEGTAYLKSGSPEAILFHSIPETGATKEELESKVGASLFPIAQANAMRQKWVKFDKNTQKFMKAVAEISDDVQKQLKAIAGATYRGTADDLKRRKLVVDSTRKSYFIERAACYAVERRQQLTELTPELIKSGAWKKEPFKEYNFDARGADIKVGTLHPLLKVRAEFRSILLGMGFSEMPTNKFVESSFWNFDALFQPQQHPARDSHDTFFLKAPITTPIERIPSDYLAKVKQIHEEGGYGSIGYRYDWKVAEAQKNILRTHTTAVSTRMLYMVAQQKTFTPVRFFSIDRVFRNETLDATHLAEFHQVEGLVADRNLTLGDLIGTIKTFFYRIGITNIRFKPAFNPYTEPSMEIFGYSNELKKWIEIGNSGMFRPEMLRPMGLPEDVQVIAWGLSLERPTMIKYGIRNIRDLFGYKVKLKIIEKNGIARFDQYHPDSYQHDKPTTIAKVH